jgi:TPR repeat protein
MLAVFIGYSQDCSKIKNELNELEKQLNEKKPETYRIYADKIKYAWDKNCVSSVFGWTWIDNYVKAALNGDFLAAIKYGYFRHFALYGLPRDTKTAGSSYWKAIEIADNMSGAEYRKESGWIASVMFFDLLIEFYDPYEQQYNDTYLKHLQKFNIKDLINQEDLIPEFVSENLLDYYFEVKGLALYYGLFGEDQDILKALQYLINGGYEKRAKVLIEIFTSSEYKNDAMALYSYNLYLNEKDVKDIRTKELYISKFNELYALVGDLDNFKKNFNTLDRSVLIQLAENKWEIDDYFIENILVQIKKSKFIETGLDPNWKYLSQTEKNEAFEFANNSKDQPDERKAAIYKSMLSENDYRASMHLAWHYYYGKGLPKNYSKAFYHFKQSVENTKSEYSAYMLGYMYDHGQGVETDSRNAFEYYGKAPSMNNAILAIGEIYLFGTEWIKPNYDNGLQYFTKALEKGDVTAKNYFRVLNEIKNGVVEKTLSNGVKLRVEIPMDQRSPVNLSLNEMYFHEIQYDIPPYVGTMELFPTKKDENGKLYSDAIFYGPYSGSPSMTGKGMHSVGVTNTTPDREIGYLYVAIYFDGKYTDYIQIPSIVAWN